MSDKQTLVTDLIAKFERKSVPFVQAQNDMLVAQDALKLAESNYRYTLALARARAQGKNAEVREGEALQDDEVEECAQQMWEAQATFNEAYRVYKQHESEITTLREIAGLVKVLP